MSIRINDEPLTLASYAILNEGGDQARNYLQASAHFQLAERLGVEGVWIRQFHLRHDDRSGGLPSPLVFLAHLAASTSTLRLGTGIVTLPLESPLRVAEDAAVLDALSGGRLELGVANGGGAPGLTETFGRPSHDDPAVRKDAYARDLARLTDALEGRQLDGSGSRLNPPAPGLARRLWEATLSEESGHKAGLRGHGVLLGTTQTVPAEVTAVAYYRGLAEADGEADAEQPNGRPTRPRVGLATLIYPARDRETALREAAEGIEEKYEWGKDFLPPATTLADKAASINLHYGTSDDIAESILTQPAFPFATQLLVQTELFYRDYAHRAEALEQFTAEIAPSLGWQGAPERAALQTAGGAR